MGRAIKNERRERRRVTRAIKLALARIAEQDPEFARLLTISIKTGTYLSYMPVPPPPRSAPREARKTPPSSCKSPIRH